MKIFLNPGHGGKDPGTVSASGIKEAEVCRKVAEILEARLKLNGYPVQLFQEKNGLADISEAENKSGATLFISIHCNGVLDKSANGVEVYHHPHSAKGKELAKIMQKELVKASGFRDRGVKSENFYVLRKTKAPAILIELGFLSNPKEEKMISENPKLFADAIWEGIKVYKAKGML